ncbi:AAA family ATPase [Sulfurimonas indica]|uniref:AAA family ATPase n=1 Tax=Sulfurimonas indica TaxID=2508707 RepID=UPI00165FAF3C|nr:AAA family ATPase [Sulfurimonas indica]
MEEIDFSEISREDIIKAFHKYDELKANNQINPHRQAKDYILFWNSKEYPQKYIVGIAYGLKYGQDILDSSLYNATGNHKAAAQWCLERNGFVLYADKKYKKYLEGKYDNQTTINTYYSDLKKAIKIFQNIEKLKEKNLNEIFESMKNGEISFEEYDKAQKELGFDDKQLFSTLKTKAKTYLEALKDRRKKIIEEEDERFYLTLANEFELTTRKPHLSSGRQYFQIYPKNTPISEGTGGTHYEFEIKGDDVVLALHLENRIKDREGLKKYLNIPNPASSKRVFSETIVTNMTENEIREKFQKLYNQYEEKINQYYQLGTTTKEKTLEEKEVNLQALNQILYGPPGTGKTYKINKLKEQFIYKESSISDVEWVKKIVEELTWFEVVSLVLYDLEKEAKVPEIAKHELIIAKAELLNKKKGVPQQIWAALQTHTILESTTVNYKTRVEPLVFDKLKNSIWRLIDGFEEKTPELISIYDKYKNGKPLSQELHNYKFITFHQSYGYEEFVEGIKAIPAGEMGNEDGEEMIYQVTDGIFKKMAERAKKNPNYKYALFIDEINRGNISKIFGELITLIEDGKRLGQDEGMEIVLPYSNSSFGVPDNLYIIGTMNTADRSIALMDTALRRRFEFTEMMPDLEVVKNVSVEDINVYKLLETINKRIEYLYDRDHTIGHAYFMRLKEENNLGTLATIFKNKIIPLLQEYFYDDWEKIRLVLGDNQKSDKSLKFIIQKEDYSMKELFGDSGLDLLEVEEESSVYEINEVAFNHPLSYIRIYEN